MKKFSYISLIIVAAAMHACSPNNVTVKDNLKAYFDEHKVTGTFCVFDNNRVEFEVYNLNRFKDSAYLPASTFKIVNSLIGLQTGVITNEKMVIPWDGKVRMMNSTDTATEWNKDLTMEQAFKASAVPYYQEVARRIGKDTMQLWLDSLSYGKNKITTPIDSFWLNNNIKVTPDEQMGLVKKLYFNQLPFNKTTLEIVKKVMVQENNAKYILAYKTGWGFAENGNAIGWVIGWIEENKHPHFFVLNIEGDKNTNIATARKDILTKCLTSLGYLQGKR